MKKPARLTVLVAAVLVVFVFLLAETVVVKVKTTSIRSEPKFTAAVVAALKAGDSLEKLEARSGWVKVKTKAGVVGWVHSTAVQTKKVNLTAMDKTMQTQASAGEVALAAKGFNKQVEDKYRAANPAARFRCRRRHGKGQAHGGRGRGLPETRPPRRVRRGQMSARAKAFAAAVLAAALVLAGCQAVKQGAADVIASTGKVSQEDARIPGQDRRDPALDVRRHHRGGGVLHRPGHGRAHPRRSTSSTATTR